jgi:hypothetical protein
MFVLVNGVAQADVQTWVKKNNAAQQNKTPFPSPLSSKPATLKAAQ